MTKPTPLRPLAALLSIGLCGISLVGTQVSATPTFEIVDAFQLGPQQPFSPVVRDVSGILYGASQGGANGSGVIYKVGLDGAVTNLYNFDLNGGWTPTLLLGSDGNLYGVGAVGGNPVIYRLTPGGAFTALHVFNDSTEGLYPSNLIQAADGSFFGTTNAGGANGRGTIFKITASGTFTKVVDLDNDAVGYKPACLIQGADGDFYGLNQMTNDPVRPEAGTLFRMTSSGGLSVVASFGGIPSMAFPYFNGLIQASDGNFYGTSQHGGAGYNGTVFKVSPAGDITLLAESATQNWEPKGGVVEGADGALYGTSVSGGEGEGTVYRLTKAGELSILAAFTQADNGPFRPQAGVIAGADGNFYGTTPYGGSRYGGVVFRITSAGDLTLVAEFDGISGFSPDTRLAESGDGYLYGSTVQGGFTGHVAFKVGKQGGIVQLGDLPNEGVFEGLNLYYDGFREGFDGNLLGVTPQTRFGPGQVVELSTSGDFTVLHQFDETEGFKPSSILKTGPDEAFGVTTDSYLGYVGTFFKMNSSGDITTISGFDPYDFGQPNGGLIRASDGNFYGTTLYSEGGGGNGAVYKITPDGVISALVNFDGSDDIVAPFAGVTEGPDGCLYGLCAMAGPEGYGVAYKVTLDGTLSLLANFGPGTGAGGMPNGELELGPDGAFYGTTVGNIANDNANGTVFRLAVDGTLTTIHEFNYADGANPTTGLLRASDGNLYGTTSYGGTTADGLEGGGGQIFRIHFGADVTTMAAGDLASSSATLNATVNPGGYATTVTFEYGTSPTLSGATTVSGGVLPAGATALPVSGALTGLAPGTTYYFRALASNAETPVVQKGEILSFTTPEAAHLGVSAGGHAVADGGKVIAGWAVTGHSTDVTLTLTNTSTTAALAGIGASVSGGDAGQFTVITAPATTLAPGATTTAVIRFTPSSSGIKGTTLALTSSDPDDASREVLLRGAGLTPAQARVAAVIRWILSLL